MLLLPYIRWAKNPSRPQAETDVPKFFWMQHWYKTNYFRMDQVKFAEKAFKIWRDLVSRNSINNIFLKDIFHKFYLVHSCILCPIMCINKHAVLVKSNSVVYIFTTFFKDHFQLNRKSFKESTKFFLLKQNTIMIFTVDSFLKNISTKL